MESNCVSGKLCVDFRRSSTSSSTGGVPTVSSGSGSSLAADIQRLVALGQKGMSALNSGSQGPSNASLAQENRKRSYERSRETSSSFHHRPQVSRFIGASIVRVTNHHNFTLILAVDKICVHCFCFPPDGQEELSNLHLVGIISFYFASWAYHGPKHNILVTLPGVRLNGESQTMK